MLVVDDHYLHAWRALGLPKQPNVMAYDFATWLDVSHPEWFRLALAGGSGHNGMTFGPAFLPTDAIPAEARVRFEGVHPKPTTMSLTQFTDSVCMIVSGVPVSRRRVIQYVANKLGGVHLDSTRNRSGDEVFKVLDTITYEPAKAPIQLHNPPLPLPYHELLSIGRCLAQAPDTVVFLKRAEQASC